MRRVLALGLFLVAAGCGDDTHPTLPDAGPDAPTSQPSARFQPAAGPLSFLAVPYPCDLYRDGAGIKLLDLPTPGGITQNARAIMADALAQDPGFGLSTGLFFGVDGAAQLAGDKLAQNLHLLDLAGGSEIGLEQPVYDAAHGRIWTQPLTRLKGNYAYGAFLDGAVGLSASAAFVAARAMAAPADPVLARAHDLLAPLWQYVPRERAVSATVFTTHDPTPGLPQAVAQAEAVQPVARNVTVIQGAALETALGTPITDQPGLDNPGTSTMFGITHAHVRAVIHGTYDGPNFLTATASAGQNGVFVLDGTGTPMQKGTQPIGWTLVLPVGTMPAGGWPVALFMHGLAQTRLQAFAIADALAAHGVATFAPDLLFHGDRYHNRTDTRNELTRDPTPDGVGDEAGSLPALQFLAVGAVGTGARMFDPLLTRDDNRQAVVDLIVAARFVKQGDLGAIRAADPSLQTLALRRDRMVGIAEGYGMPLLLLAAWLDPSFTAIVGSQPSGGLLIPFMSTTPAYAVQFIPIFGALFNIASEIAQSPWQHPMLTLYQQVLEPGDTLALAPTAPAQHTLIVQAFSDEVASNQSEELLEYFLGLPALGGGMYRYQSLVPGPLPASGNLSGLTAGVVQYLPATWDLYQRRQTVQVYRPGFPPFTKWPDPGMTISNPIAAVQTQIATFVATHFASPTGTPTIQ